MSDIQQPNQSTGRRSSEHGLSVVTVDAQGRVPLGHAAREVGWAVSAPVELAVDDHGMVHLSEAREVSAGVTAIVDRRGRVHLPYGVRVMTGIAPGRRLVVLTTVERDVVLVPVASLLGTVEPDARR